MEKTRPRTVKQKKFVKELIKNGGNATQAALAVYDIKNPESSTPRTLGHELVRQLNITELMEVNGISDEKLMETLHEGLEANKVIAANIIITTPTDPDAKPTKADSLTKDFIEVPDHPTRHKFLETGLKLKGLVPKETEVTFQQNNITIYTPEKYADPDV